MFRSLCWPQLTYLNIDSGGRGGGYDLVSLFFPSTVPFALNSASPQLAVLRLRQIRWVLINPIGDCGVCKHGMGSVDFPGRSTGYDKYSRSGGARGGCNWLVHTCMLGLAKDSVQNLCKYDMGSVDFPGRSSGCD